MESYIVTKTILPAIVKKLHLSKNVSLKKGKGLLYSANLCLFKSGKRDSNPRPSAWEANALPTELFPQ